jgi:glycosyltransferase involved in cell wall biosynthesis
VRIYESVRTAHLERAHQLEPAAIVYRRRRYDFDEELTRGLELRRTSTRGAARLMFASRPREVEINEPMSDGPLFTALALLGLDLRRLVGGERAVVTTYAIANLDPVVILRRFGGPRSRLRLAMYQVLSRFIWRRLDRIVYGTDAARDLYHEVFSRRPELEETTIAALPVPRAVSDEQKQDGTVVFLGALVERKGFPLLLDAWPLVHERRPEAKLTIVGKGVLADRAARAAATDPSIELLLDPPRERIFSVLDASRTLVLPSQPMPAWREQVGLPIVEGLSSGCSIVTTTETGIADWLADHGHAVLPADADAAALADAIVAQLDARRPASSVLAALPGIDGRLAADRALFRPEP